METKHPFFSLLFESRDDFFICLGLMCTRRVRLFDINGVEFPPNRCRVCVS